MARKHTQLAKSRLLQYTEIQATSIPAGTTVYEVATLPSTVDVSKDFIYVTETAKYYRIKPKEPGQYNASTEENGVMMGEPAVNVASGYEAIFVHKYPNTGSSTDNNGLSVYKPITESIDLYTTSMYTPTAQAVSKFVLPEYNTTVTSSTPTILLKENVAFQCTNAGVTSVTLNVSDVYGVTTPKTRETRVYFHTGSNPTTLSLTGTGSSSMTVIGDNSLLPDKDYVVSVKDNTVVINTDPSSVLYEEVTYSQLVTKINNSRLVKGRKYRITDYVTTTTQSNTSSAGHAFDLVVTAIDVNELDCNASALLHSGDTYFSTAGADLSKWQIWYDVNNDTNKYEWADTTNGRGVIYRMIDEWRNDCPYDFKNILFTKANSYTSAYTFNKFTSGDTANSDYSLTGYSCQENVIKGLYYKELNFIVILNGGIANEFNYTSHDIVLRDGCSYNVFEAECYDIDLTGSTYNFFAYGCATIVFGNNCSYNTIERECYDVTFYNYCQNNRLGGYDTDIEIDNNSINNNIGFSCSNIHTGAYCCYNTFADYCNNVILSGNCQYNSFGGDCNEISLANACYNVSIGGFCTGIVFGNSSSPSIGGGYCKDIIIEKGNKNIRIYNTSSPSASNYLQNIYIAQGCSGTSSAYTEISTIARNLSYRTTVGRDSSGNIRIYNEDDPASASQAQANWNETNSSSPSYIQNKPTIPTVPTHRTVNHEQITDSSLGDINLHDGFYFPNAYQDYDGNWYGAVVIGDQVWLGENLRTKHLPDGTAITSGNPSTTELHYKDYTSHSLPVEKRGLLYSYAVTASIAPQGWKFPSESEFAAMAEYLDKQTRYSSAVAKAMAATSGWDSSETTNAVGNDQTLNNASGFSMYPTGTVNSSGSFVNENISTIWASTNKGVFIYAGSVVYYSTSYAAGSWSLAIRLLSTMTPIQFRDWYVKTYGTMQHDVDDCLVYMGTLGSSSATITSLPDNHRKGWTYKVISTASYAGKNCVPGDIITCVSSGVSANNSDWELLTNRIVKGPASSTANHVATFSGTSGSVLKDSGYTINANVPSGAVFSDERVTPIRDNHDVFFPILFALDGVNNSQPGIADNVVGINPNSGNIKASLINGFALQNACAKDVDTSITLGTTSTNLPTSKAVNDFVVPSYNTTYSTATPSITMVENTVYRCTNASVTSLTLNITNMVSGPKTRESVVYFHTGSSPTLTISGSNSSTMVFGDTTLMANTDYAISVKDNTVAISTFVDNLSTVATSGSYLDLTNKPILNTTSATALATNASETITGTINLHKVSKTGAYSDLIGTPTIPSAPGTLDTTATTPQATNASEALSGNVTLHKISKTGKYSDVVNPPVSGKNIEIKSLIPDEYTLLDWAANNAETSIVTDFIADVDDIEIELVLRPTAGIWYMFQNRPTNSDIFIGLMGTAADNDILFRFGNTTLTSTITRSSNNGVYIIRAKAKNGNMSLYVEIVSTGVNETLTGTYTFENRTTPYCIWANNVPYYANQGNRVYSLKVWKAGVLTLDLYPVMRKSDSIVGFYDTRTSKFLSAIHGSAYNNSTETVENPLAINVSTEVKYNDDVTTKTYVDTNDVKSTDQTYFPKAVQDYEGHWYDAVIIGDQVWMVQNLQTKYLPNGTAITGIDGFNATTPDYVSDSPRWFCYAYDYYDYINRYGLLYNWYAAMNGSTTEGDRGIAPSGWHIPTQTEFDTLLAYLRTKDIYINSNGISKALASQYYWYAVASSNFIGTNTYLNNMSGWSGTPGGRKSSDLPSDTNYVTYNGYWWTSTPSDTSGNVVSFTIGYSTVNPIYHTSSSGVQYRSVRCICDKTPLQFREWYYHTYGTTQHTLDYMVSQNATSTDATYNLLLKNAAGNTDETNAVKYSSGLNYNPSTNLLTNAGDIVSDGDVRVKGNDLYIGSATTTQCHQQYDNTNKCLKFIFD